jgi:hypothetical protein
MRKRMFFGAAVLASGLLPAPVTAQERSDYPWLDAKEPATFDTISRRFPPPPGFIRRPLTRGGFGHWLRHLPLKPPGTPVLLFDGRRKARQDVHRAVIDIDVGRADLQQCADAAIRLRAEFLFARGRVDDIGFNYTNGEHIAFRRWAAGWRPVVEGAKVRWRRTADESKGRETLKRYLRAIFTYAGSYSLSRELTNIGHRREARVGDIFLQGGFPGHAVIIVDRADNPQSGKTVLLLAQSYMPAQDLHVLANPRGAYDPWYVMGEGERLETPEWTFTWQQRFSFDNDAVKTLQ